MRFRFTYETPLGVFLEGVDADTRHEADRMFWSEHRNRDVCHVLEVSVFNYPGPEVITEEARICD